VPGIDVELDLAGAPGRRVGDLGLAILEAVGFTRMRCGSPVTGFLIGAEVVSNISGATMRAVRLSRSKANSMGRNCGVRMSLTIMLMIWKKVPSTCSLPDRIVISASRCFSSARSSMTAWIVPLPSWSAPGQW
jgi:hypothetical protein